MEIEELEGFKNHLPTEMKKSQEKGKNKNANRVEEEMKQIFDSEKV